MSRPKVLVNIHSNSFFPELHRVALLLSRSGKYEPLMFFGWDYATIQRDIALCLSEGLTCLDEAGKVMPTVPDATSRSAVSSQRPPPPAQRHFIIRTFRKLPLLWQQKIKHAYFGFFLLVRSYLYWNDRFALIRGVIGTHQPKLIVIGGDLVHYDTAVLIRVAHDHGVKALIVPTMMSDQLEMAESYLNSPGHDYRRPLNRLLGLLYPRWIYTHKGKKLVRTPASWAFPMEWKGIAPPDPWILHSGFADAIAVESDAMVEYYRRCGLPQAKLVSTGSPANDNLARALSEAESLRENLYQRLGLPPGKPMLLTALPPDQHYLVGGRPECDFATYGELVEFWMNSIRAVEGFNRIVCLHPAVHKEDWLHLERDGVKIAAEGTPDLIPLCDLFVASVSSVIRWAIGAGKPVVNYDLYKFRYNDYRKSPGVLTMETQSEYLDTLKRLTSDPAFLSEVADRQKQSAAHWARLDGKAGERILALVNQLSN